MSFLGAATAAAAGLANSGLQFAGNKKLLNMQIDQQNRMFEQQTAWEKEKMQNAYTWTMQDLKNAGLNPTLMMGDVGSANMAGSSSPGAPSGGNSGINPLGDAISAMKISKELGLMDAQKENIDADTNLKGAQSGKTEAETEFQKTQNKYQSQLLSLEVALKSETNREIRANIEKTINESDKIQKEIEKTEKEIDILKSQGKIAEAEAKTRVNNRRAYAILEMTESATRSVGNVVGAVKGTSALPTFGNSNVSVNSNSNSNVVHWRGN